MLNVFVFGREEGKKLVSKVLMHLNVGPRSEENGFRSAIGATVFSIDLSGTSPFAISLFAHMEVVFSQVTPYSRGRPPFCPDLSGRQQLWLTLLWLSVHGGLKVCNYYFVWDAASL